MTFSGETYNNFIYDFSNVLRKKIQDLEISELIFLCIGTDRITGDSFGPLVGYKLKHLFREEKNIKVVGDLENIVTIHNVEKIIKNINSTYEIPFIIAIDAAISNKNNIGKIIVSEQKMNVGSGLNKKSIYIGDVSIKGIVAKDLKKPQYNFKLLQNTPLGLIMNMAECTAYGIYNVINV